MSGRDRVAQGTGGAIADTAQVIDTAIRAARNFSLATEFDVRRQVCRESGWVPR